MSQQRDFIRPVTEFQQHTESSKMAENQAETPSAPLKAPHPGVRSMPDWDVGELIDAPIFTWRNWFALLGPGLLMGGAAIGGGEWLVGPIVTAKYGGMLLWLATLSILGQVIYNIEISRYTLYCGEPIFTGKFRTLPGPAFWVLVYLLLDFGAIFPYLAAHAATPLASVILGDVPNTTSGQWDVLGSGWIISHKRLLRVLGYLIFLGAMIPLIIGGKIYNALKGLMTFKIIVVLGFLLILAALNPNAKTWSEIFSGFFKFGNVPIRANEDTNKNGRLDLGEDWDNDGHLDVMEPSLRLKFGTVFRADYATDINEDGQPDHMVSIAIDVDGKQKTVPWPDLDEDGRPDEAVTIDTDGDARADGTYKLERGKTGQILYRNKAGTLNPFIDVDSDGTRDGDAVANVFTSGKMPQIDWSLIAFLSALVAISGAGGLSNTPISNYTRDQGWGMGHHVGAIPSVVGGHNIQLSHVGTVFQPNDATLPRWKRWYRHVARDQLAVWMPACFFGLALPSMLSVEYLPRGTEVADRWVAAAMTAGAVQDHFQGRLGSFFWFMTLFCGFLVLAPSMATTADGVIRRWVDVFWTSSKTLRRIDPQNIRYVYFGVLSAYALFGLAMLSLQAPDWLLTIATIIFNFALGFSCWHTLAVNMILLPKPLRPNWFVRIALLLAGAFFWIVATIAALQKFGMV